MDTFYKGSKKKGHEFEKIKVTSFPACIIINTDISTQPGKHWLAIYYIDKNNVKCVFYTFLLIKWKDN